MPMTPPRAHAKRPRRASKPAKPLPRKLRHHILVDCNDEAMQRELFELLTKRGAPCRLLLL